jgi:hypothetical protein
MTSTKTKRLAAVIAMLVATSACGEDCPRRLVTNVSYTGATEGILYVREFMPSGASTGGSSGHTRSGGGGGSSDACWDSTEKSDESGWMLESWVDVNGNDAERCGDVLRASRTACGPEEGDPQGTTTFAVKGSGTTRIQLTYGDP